MPGHHQWRCEECLPLVWSASALLKLELASALRSLWKQSVLGCLCPADPVVVHAAAVRKYVKTCIINALCYARLQIAFIIEYAPLIDCNH